jgi:DNA-binding IclR family transcriptional regulator
MEQEKKGIQSIELGFSILKEISRANHPLTITELSKLCNMPKSQLYRYLISLCKVGALQKGVDLRYSLGREILTMGIFAVQKTDITVKAFPYIKKLNEQLNETVSLAIWVEEEGPLVVEWVESNKPFNINVRTGSLVDLTTSATGCLFATFLSEEKTRNLIQKELEQRSIDQLKFESRIAFAKKESYVYTTEYLKGITAIAAPVFDYKKELVATIFVVGLTGVLDYSKDSAEVKELLKTARQLSESLGYSRMA